jgi:hypothetical protein
MLLASCPMVRDSAARAGSSAARHASAARLAASVADLNRSLMALPQSDCLEVKGQSGAAMVETAEREPTMEEIVVALRETRRDAGRVPAFTVVDGQPGGKRELPSDSDAPPATASSNDISDLRDSEIARLLAENAHLNERIVFLLKVIDHEQARNERRAMECAATETERSTIFRDVRAALAAELRPVLLVLLRLLEQQRADPVEAGAYRAARETARRAAPEATPSDDDGIIDLDALRL